MRILFTSAGLPGDLRPVVPLAWACRCLGLEVLVATAEDVVPDVLRTELPAYSLGPSYNDGPDTPEATGPARSAAARRTALGRVFARTARRNLREMWDLVGRWAPDIVVSEPSEIAGPIVAAAHDVPWVESHRELAPLTEYRDAAEAELGDHPLWSGRPRADLVLSPWPPSLRSADAMTQQSMRQVPGDGGGYVPGWLITELARPRICVALDTGGCLLADLVEELAALDADILVATDDGPEARVEPLPRAVRRIGRSSVANALATCTAMIGHGDRETTLAALAGGCPQLLLPRFDDELDNSEAVLAAGVGAWLLPGAASPSAVARAFGGVLGDGFRTAAAAAAAEFAAQPVPTEIATLLGCLV